MANTNTDGPQNLTRKITHVKRAPFPHGVRWGMTAGGYTAASGAPTDYLIRLDGAKRWRRLMFYQISNAGSCFVRGPGGAKLWISDHRLPDSGQVPADGSVFEWSDPGV